MNINILFCVIEQILHHYMFASAQFSDLSKLRNNTGVNIIYIYVIILGD